MYPPLAHLARHSSRHSCPGTGAQALLPQALLPGYPCHRHSYTGTPSQGHAWPVLLYRARAHRGTGARGARGAGHARQGHRGHRASGPRAFRPGSLRLRTPPPYDDLKTAQKQAQGVPPIVDGLSTALPSPHLPPRLSPTPLSSQPCLSPRTFPANAALGRIPRNSAPAPGDRPKPLFLC